MYADDTTFLKAIYNDDDRKQLQQSIDKLDKWTRANFLTMNAAKTVHVSYTRNNCWILLRSVVPRPHYHGKTIGTNITQQHPSSNSYTIRQSSCWLHRLWTAHEYSTTAYISWTTDHLKHTFHNKNYQRRPNSYIEQYHRRITERGTTCNKKCKHIWFWTALRITTFITFKDRYGKRKCLPWCFQHERLYTCNKEKEKSWENTNQSSPVMHLQRNLKTKSKNYIHC